MFVACLFYSLCTSYLMGCNSAFLSLPLLWERIHPCSKLAADVVSPCWSDGTLYSMAYYCGEKNVP